MKRRLIRQDLQRRLLECEPPWSPPALSPDATRKAIVVLAEMLLEAARALDGVQQHGGRDDKSENHG